jgi:hypothetical protein
MAQPIDFNKPVYSAVNISIRKPEVNTKSNASNPLTVNNDNGIYNAVKIDIDNPRVNNGETQKIYDYPEAEGIVTYEMLNLEPIALPPAKEESNEAESEQETVSDEAETIQVPTPNYTTLEAEKTDLTEKKINNVSKLSFKAAEQEVQKPEIVPSEPILPRVDIALVSENLASADKDVQAQQMEEIVRLAIMEPEKAKDYLVGDVFSGLIKITEEDASALPAPTKEQIEARQKLISNIMAVEKDKNAINNLPFPMSDEEVAFATNLSPMELTERNKEYAVTALGALAELFIEDYQAKEGKVVPITDAPGISAIVNALRKDPDSGVKLAAIDALRRINRPEYKEELSALFMLAQTDPNPNVSRTAAKAIAEVN